VAKTHRAKLIGWIESIPGKLGGRTVRFRFYTRDEFGRRVKQSIDCNGDLQVAAQVQLEISQRAMAGTLHPKRKYKMVYDDDVRRAERFETPRETFVDLWLARVALEIVPKPGTPATETLSYRNTKRWLDRFFKYAAARRTGDLSLEAADTKFKTRRLEDGVAPESVNREYDAIRKALRWGYEEGYFRRDIAAKISDVAADDDGDVVVIESWDMVLDMFTVCEQVTPDFSPMLWMAMKTGARRGDLMDMPKTAFREASRRLAWRPNKTRRSRQKSKRPREASVPLEPDVFELCRALVKDPKNATPFLFVNSAGRRWRPKRLAKRITVLRAAMQTLKGKTVKGPNMDPEAKRINFNAFRHTFGSAITQMFDLARAADLLDHSDIRVTRKHYINTELAWVDKNARALPYSIWSVLGERLWRFSVPKPRVADMDAYQLGERRDVGLGG
jgi:site-specific recombinase XerD